MNKFNPMQLTDYDIDGVDRRDYPDFCDAFLAEASVGDYELTEDELQYVTDTYPEWLWDEAYQSLI